VGKSTIAASLAVSLAGRGKRVGLLDADLHGPSIPHLLGIGTARMTGSESTIQPAVTPAGLRVVSVAFLLRSPDDALIWRGPIKHSIIKQFIANTEWGDLDYLIVDSPPGTGDEPLSVAQLLNDADGALVVTTPQMISVIDVRKAVSFLHQVGLPVLGIVENMSGYVCPKCGAHEDVFGTGGGEAIAEDMGVPFVGRVPVDPELVRAADAGALEPYLNADSPGARAFAPIVERLLDEIEGMERRNDDA